jgi:hypothetical protein
MVSSQFASMLAHFIDMTRYRFVTPEAIIEHFFRHRLAAYDRRKAHQVTQNHAFACYSEIVTHAYIYMLLAGHAAL